MEEIYFSKRKSNRNKNCFFKERTILILSFFLAVILNLQAQDVLPFVPVPSAITA